MIENYIKNVLSYQNVFIGFSGFRGSLKIKYMSFNKEQCISRPTIIFYNSVEFNYFLFIICLDKCSVSFSSVDDLSSKI